MLFPFQGDAGEEPAAGEEGEAGGEREEGRKERRGWEIQFAFLLPITNSTILMCWVENYPVTGQAQAQDKCRQAAKAKQGCGAGEALLMWWLFSPSRIVQCTWDGDASWLIMKSLNDALHIPPW